MDKQSTYRNMNGSKIITVAVSIIGLISGGNTNLMRNQERLFDQNNLQVCNCRIYDPKCQKVCLDLSDNRMNGSNKPFIRFVERNIGKNMNSNPYGRKITPGDISNGTAERNDLISYNGMTYKACELHDWADRNYLSRGYLNLRADLRELYNYVRGNPKISNLCMGNGLKSAVSLASISSTQVSQKNLESPIDSSIKGSSSGDSGDGLRGTPLKRRNPMMYPTGTIVKGPLIQKDVDPVIVERISIKTVPVFINEPAIEEISPMRMEPIVYEQGFPPEPEKEYIEKVQLDVPNTASLAVWRTTSTTTTTIKVTRSVQGVQDENAEPRKAETTITTTVRVVRKQESRDRYNSEANKMETTTVYKTISKDQEKSMKTANGGENMSKAPTSSTEPPVLAKKSLDKIEGNHGTEGNEILEKVRELLFRPSLSSSGFSSASKLGTNGVSTTILTVEKLRTVTIHESASSASVQDKPTYVDVDRAFDEATRELIRSIFELLKKSNEGKNETSIPRKNSTNSVFTNREVESKLRRVESVNASVKSDMIGKFSAYTVQGDVSSSEIVSRITILSTTTETVTRTKRVTHTVKTSTLAGVKEPKYSYVSMSRISPNLVTSSKVYNSYTEGHTGETEIQGKRSTFNEKHEMEIRKIYEKLMMSERREKGLMDVLMEMNRRSKTEEAILDILRESHLSNGNNNYDSKGLHSEDPQTSKNVSTISDVNTKDGLPSLTISSVSYLTDPKSVDNGFGAPTLRKKDSAYATVTITNTITKSFENIKTKYEISTTTVKTVIMKEHRRNERNTKGFREDLDGFSEETKNFEDRVNKSKEGMNPEDNEGVDAKTKASNNKDLIASTSPSVLTSTVSSEDVGSRREHSASVDAYIGSDAIEASISKNEKKQEEDVKNTSGESKVSREHSDAEDTTETASSARSDGVDGISVDDIAAKISRKDIPDGSLLVSDDTVIDKLVEKLAPLMDDVQVSSGAGSIAHED